MQTPRRARFGRAALERAAPWLAGTLVLAAIVAVALITVFPSTTAQAAQDPEEQAFLTIINNYRAAHGAGPLALETHLNDASEFMAGDMAGHNYMSHTDSLGHDMTTRLRSFANPFPYTAWGENVAAGYITAQEVFTGWMNSPGHNRNMLNPGFNVIGIARMTMAGTTYGTYWATDFGFLPGVYRRRQR